MAGFESVLSANGVEDPQAAALKTLFDDLGTREGVKAAQNITLGRFKGTTGYAAHTENLRNDVVDNLFKTAKKQLLDTMADSVQSIAIEEAKT